MLGGVIAPESRLWWHRG